MAAWLGLIALGLDALVPIHLAFDLGHAAAAGRHREQPAGQNFIAALLTLVTGHHDAAGGGNNPEKHHPGDHCAVCSAIATLAGFAPAAAPPVAMPADCHAVVLAALPVAAPHTGPLAAYRSRAPPIRIG